MEFVTLGKTNLMVSRSGLSTRRLELVSSQGITNILNASYQAGINFYEFSCQAMECASDAGSFFYDKRKNVVISVTTEVTDETNISSKIDFSLSKLYMDYIDVFNLKSDDKFFGKESAEYNSLVCAKNDGKINFFGFYTQNLDIAKQIIESKLYDIIHFPLNLCSSDEEFELVKLCQKNDIGIVARWPLAAGKIDNVPVAFGYLKQFENLVPVYSVRNLDEIQKLIYFEENPPIADSAFTEEVLKIKGRTKNDPSEN